jgi:mono/diheme cytochrome c family protein
MGKKMGVRDFTSPEVQKMSDDELTTLISDGKDKMPSYRKSLKPDQIKDLVGYIRSLAAK